MSWLNECGASCMRLNPLYLIIFIPPIVFMILITYMTTIPLAKKIPEKEKEKGKKLHP